MPPVTTATLLMPPPSTTIMIRKRVSTVSASPSSPEDDDEDMEEEYRPVASSSSSAKRPNTAGTGGAGMRRAIAPKSAQQATGRQPTKQSREALRKANHSLIERRRREKINFALGELREMVPGLGDEKGGKAGEFKLEVSPTLATCQCGIRGHDTDGVTGTGTNRHTHARAQGLYRQTRRTSVGAWRRTSQAGNECRMRLQRGRRGEAGRTCPGTGTQHKEA